MYPGNALAKGAAIAATFSSSFFILPQFAAAQLIEDPSMLQKGMHGQEVKTVQLILKASGYYPLTWATGYYGRTTVKAVKNYQRARGLSVDGLVGKETKHSLISYVHRRMGLLAEGSAGANVRYLQNFLSYLGYYNGRSDGYFGPLTRQAVLNLQTTTRIRIDGIVGNQTWGSIEHLTAVKKSRAAQPREAGRRIIRRQPASEKTSTASAAASAAPAASAVHRSHPVTTVREFYANSTAYTARCNGCSGKTATGINLISHPEARVVAVDPSVIPLGTKLYVEGYGYAVAADTGGAIKGRRIDLFFNANSTALQWGRKTVKVRILSE